MSHHHKHWILGPGIAVLALLINLGCDGGAMEVGTTPIDKPTGPEPVEKSLAALVPAEGCDDLLATLKEAAIQQMETRLADNLEYAIQSMQWGCYNYPMADGDYAGGGVPTNTNGGSSDPKGESATEYSTTNNQEVGVDEADFVKNDGKYIYILADHQFQIIDAWPAAFASVISRTPVEGSATKLFVHNERAIIYSSMNPLQEVDNSSDIYGGMPYYYGQGGECTYGYDCEFTGDGRALQVTIYDISDVTAPKLLRKTDFNGSYLNSRRINDIVYSAVVFPEVVIPGVEYWPEELTEYWQDCWQTGDDADKPSTEELTAWFQELRDINATMIAEADITDFLPSVKDTRFIDGEPVVEEGLLQACANFYLSQLDDGAALLSLVSFETDGLGALEASTIVSRPGAVYASSDAFYVAVRHYADSAYGWFYEEADAIEEATTIHKFALDPASIHTTYVGSGPVKGRVLNQFAMDEHEGNLRVATTTGHLPSPDVHNTVAVMTLDEGELVITGMVDHIAPEEDIRSVRFEGNVGFIVTFKKTDPLFVLDLSDPTDPKVKGELKIPGYSTYMHMMDATHILSIGYDADDMGDFAWFNGLLLQVFDVSDMENPTLLHKHVIGTRGSASDAATNHLAFNYFASRNLLAIPIMVCEGGGNGMYGDQLTFNGLMVFRVTLEGGFQLIGGVPHVMPVVPGYENAGDIGYSNPSCSQWWSSATSQVKRSIFMEDYVYSIAMDLINVSYLTDLEHPLVSLELVTSDENETSLP